MRIALTAFSLGIAITAAIFGPLIWRAATQGALPLLPAQYGEASR